MLPETVYFDGGCPCNPGPMYVAVEIRGDIEHKVLGEVGTSNQAEFHAALFALELISKKQMTGVVLVTDSVHVKNVFGDEKVTFREPTLQALVTRLRGHPALARVGGTFWTPREHNLAGFHIQRRRAAQAKIRSRSRRQSCIAHAHRGSS